MILGIIGAIIGITLGWVRAKKRGGNTADKMQYAVAHGIAFFLAGYFIALFMAMAGI